MGLRCWVYGCGLLMILWNGSAGADASCEMPAHYKRPHQTFVINENLACSANVFLYMAPAIIAQAENRLSSREKRNPQAVGRLAYVLFGDAFAANKPPVPVKNLTVPSSTGAHKIPVRWYEGQDKGRVILFTHGGGWTRGNLETHDTLCRKLCEATGASVLAVDYRLAPEYPYPAGLMDAVDAYHFLVQQQGRDAKIFVSGDSGGGNIASSLTLKMIQEGQRIPDGVILFYPALDLRIPETSTNPYANGYLLTRDSINAYVHNYVGERYDQANDPLVSPLVAADKDLEKFPKTILVNAECDPLTEEGKVFAERLTDVGVVVHHHIVPKTIHIFAQYFDLFPEAQEALDYVKEHVGKW